MAFGSPQVAWFHLRRSIAQFRYTRIVVVLLLIGLFAYPFAPTFSTSSLIQPQVSTPQPEETHRPEPPKALPLWSYITDYAQQAAIQRRDVEEGGADSSSDSLLSPGSTGAWEWITSQRRTSAPSAGALLNEGAQASFRANLRSDKQYFLGFQSAGWNNQVMDISNSIYLSILTGRIPILPPFEPHQGHLRGEVTTVAVGEIFDLSFLSSALDNLPLVEAHELKVGDRQSPRLQHVKRSKQDHGVGSDGLSKKDQKAQYVNAVQPVVHESLGCWRFKPPNPWPWLPFQSLTVYYTPVPRHILYQGQFEHPSIYATAELLRNYYSGQIPEDSVEQLNGVLEEVAPDQQVACLDFSYFLQTKPKGGGLHEEWRKGDGVWHHVGQYLRFNPALVRIAEDYLKDVLGLELSDPKPVYMGVHIRRGDFGSWFQDFSPRHWAYKIAEVLNEVRDRTGVTIEHVVVTTDEQDEAWLDLLRGFGFTVIDHKTTRTAERLDQWFPTIIDSIILSSSKAFIGVGASTMSILAMRRVIDWNSGIAYLLHDSSQPVPEGWSWHLNDFVKGY